MAFKLNAIELHAHAKHIAACETKWHIIHEKLADLNCAIIEYNEAFNVFVGFVDDIHSEREWEYNEKSEKWQESEKGNEAYEWLNAIQEASQVEELDVVDMPGEAPHTDMENMPTEAQ